VWQKTHQFAADLSRIYQNWWSFIAAAIQTFCSVLVQKADVLYSLEERCHHRWKRRMLSSAHDIWRLSASTKICWRQTESFRALSWWVTMSIACC